MIQTWILIIILIWIQYFSPYKRDFITLNKSVINYPPRCITLTLISDLVKRRLDTKMVKFFWHNWKSWLLWTFQDLLKTTRFGAIEPIKLTQSKSKTIKTRRMCGISLIVYTDKYTRTWYDIYTKMVFHYILIISNYTTTKNTHGNTKRYMINVTSTLTLPLSIYLG